jgi:hypothetical protein
MTALEQAEDLFTTYRFALSIPKAPLGKLKDGIAKQCALIAIEKLIDESKQQESLSSFKYWRDVKKHLENYDTTRGNNRINDTSTMEKGG